MPRRNESIDAREDKEIRVAPIDKRLVWVVTAFHPQKKRRFRPAQAVFITASAIAIFVAVAVPSGGGHPATDAAKRLQWVASPPDGAM